MTSQTTTSRATEERMNATVETYSLKSVYGHKHVGMYPMVTLECGFVAKWVDRMSKREAIHQTDIHHEREIRRGEHACTR